jgi:hypothetical protein
MAFVVDVDVQYWIDGAFSIGEPQTNSSSR